VGYVEVIFLGTSGSIPTNKRNLPAVAIHRKDELILFDCGEGTQRQMILAHIGFNRKTKIFITHMHGDHVLGVPGLIQSMSLLGRTEKLEIYGPPGIKNFVKSILRTVKFTLTFPVKVFEVHGGVVYKNSEYEVRAVRTSHVVPGLAYALIEGNRSGKFHPERARALGVPKGPLWSKLQRGENVRLPKGKIVKSRDVIGPPRPGRKIVYSGDTRPFKGILKFARKADMLIHEATFSDELAERARADGHSTPSQVAKIAKIAGVKRLVLTHISARYENADVLVKKARKIFRRVQFAEDLLRIELPYSE
jgi:ribonuclease Z